MCSGYTIVSKSAYIPAGTTSVSINLSGTLSQAISANSASNTYWYVSHQSHTATYYSWITGHVKFTSNLTFRIGKGYVTAGNPIKATDFTAVGLSATVGQPIKLSGASGVIDDTWFNNNYGNP